MRKVNELVQETELARMPDLENGYRSKYLKGLISVWDEAYTRQGLKDDIMVYR